jgi:hypothetical protein
MYPVTMQMISAERGREMREQAAAWSRARKARGAAWPRPARILFAFKGNARSRARAEPAAGPGGGLRGQGWRAGGARMGDHSLRLREARLR